MKYVTFEGGFGRLDEDTVTVLADDPIHFLVAGGRAGASATTPLSKIVLKAPIPAPGKVICVGLNYRDHVVESGAEVPENPVLFTKFANSVVGDGATVEIPSVTQAVDWEAELGVIIGATGRRITADKALEYVAGYTCLNDLSARDLQLRDGQWTRGKAIDGFLPMGPVLVDTTDIPDPQSLTIRCTVNGEVMQEASTSSMIFSVAQLIEDISETMTLEPGDIIATGTPAGVGMAHDPPRYLRPGDVVVVEIEGIGKLTTFLR